MFEKLWNGMDNGIAHEGKVAGDSTVLLLEENTADCAAAQSDQRQVAYRQLLACVIPHSECK